MLMNTRKRWATKKEAEDYAIKAFQDGNVGLSYCAACDFLGWSPTDKDTKDFGDALYADWLISMGEEYIKEEIANIKWELDTMEYVELNKFKPSIRNLERYLKIAKNELRYLRRRRWRD